MKKTLRKIIPAIAMLLISATLVGTSTFAWFSMNSKVTVTGMTVSTKIGDSLQIAGDTLGSTAKLADSNFKNGLNQSVAGTLEPVSTVDGAAFWYTSTSNVQADGNAITDTYTAYNEDTALANATAGKANYDDEFNTNYGITSPDTSTVVYGYVDYVFQLKAINTDSSNSKDVRMTKVNLLYNYAAAAANEIKAFRVAVFAEDISSLDPAGGVGTLKTVLRQSGAAYFTATDKAISENAAPTTAVTNIDTGATLGSVSAGTTKYFKIVVRMWLEGEDTTCNNSTFLTLTKDWTLDLAIELTNDALVLAATNITTVAGAVAEVDGGDAKVGNVKLDGRGKLDNGETPATYAWKNAADGSAAAGTNNAATYTASAYGDFYCLITTTKGSVYKTNTITLDVA